MKLKRSRVFFWLSSLLKEDGQDLVEYALLAGLIVLGVTAGVGSYAAKVGTVFSNLATTFSTVV
jgi:pilus assembly protein Flp/PilA